MLFPICHHQVVNSSSFGARRQRRQPVNISSEYCPYEVPLGVHTIKGCHQTLDTVRWSAASIYACSQNIFFREAQGPQAGLHTHRENYPSRAPYQGLIRILWDIADIAPNSIFCIIWHLWGSRCVQNNPTRCGNDLPILLRNPAFD